jgi:hypothetical protein
MTNDATTDDLRVLRALSLKGRADVALLAGASGLTADAVRSVLEPAVARDEVKQAGERHRLTPAGRDRVAALIEAARAGVDADTLEVLYERFHEPNTEIKELMTAWQMRDGEPNDHTDRAYDDAVAARIVDHHAAVEGLVAEISASAGHLAAYPDRLAAAARRVGEGDHDLVAKPLIDSYHTVWFELHEELIALLGRNRVDEAKAGRAL